MRDDTDPHGQMSDEQDGADDLEAAPKKGRRLLRYLNKSLVQSGRLTTLLALILIIGIRFEDPGVLVQMRTLTFDFYQTLNPRPLVEDSPVVIVDLDERSISELGQWPWPRTVLGELVETMNAQGAKVIGFDVVFAEADRTSLNTVVAEMQNLDPALRAQLSTIKSNDEIFAEILAEQGNVVLGGTFAIPTENDPPSVSRSSFQVVGADPANFIENHNYVLPPLPELAEAAAGTGIFSVSANRIDGIVRRVPLVMKIAGERRANADAVGKTTGLLPALTLEMLRVGLNARSIGVRTDDVLGVEQIALRPARSRERIQVATNAAAQVWVYFTPHSELRNTMYYSAVDVLNGDIPAGALEDKYILFGPSAQGLRDVRATPLDKTLPGVEVHANILENILFDQRLIRNATFETIEVLAAIAAGLIIIIVAPAVGARWGAITLLVLVGGMVGFSWNAFTTNLELYDPVFPSAVAILFYSFLTYAAFTQTERQRKEVRTAFSQYLSPDLVKQLADDPSQLALGGENREMTFMFSDVRGFTSISELFDAQGLTRLINKLLTPLTNVIMDHHGTIDKYMGDCVMAFWNAPLKVEDHASQACQAALEMLEEVDRVNEVLEQEAEEEGREHRPLAVGIGLNSGIACVGNMGSDQRFDYSVLGDNVNLASRLEGQSKAYGVKIIIGDDTAAQAPEYAILELDLIKVKGKQQAVRIFALVGDVEQAGSDLFQKLKSQHDAFKKAYRAQDWAAAVAEMETCRTIALEGEGLIKGLGSMYDVFLARIEEFKLHPLPEDWDGVYVATSK